jgi:carbamoyl-phosphate synthase large subunit
MDNSLTNNINVLMTGAGAPGAAGIIACLHADPIISLTVADANEHAVGRYLNERFYQIPAASANDFIEKILALCVKENIQVIMPLVTRELFVFAANIEKFNQLGIRVLLSDSEALHIANNKSELLQFLQTKGIATPDFRVVNSLAAFKNALSDLGYPAKTVCFKPSVANGSRGFRILSSQQNDFDLLFNQKPNSTYISLEKIIEIYSQHEKEFPELLVSEYLPGEEYSVDCLANQGECIIALPRLRSIMREGISIAGVFEQDQEIIAYCQQIISAIKLHGNIGIQVKRADDGSFKILEINPRVQGTIVAAMGAGVNLPLLAVKQAMQMPIEPAAIPIKWGTRFIRYYQEVYY